MMFGLKSRSNSSRNTVRPVLRGHPWDKEKVALKTGDYLKEVQFAQNVPYQDKKKVTF